MTSLQKAHKNMLKEKACERCGFLQGIELHHIKSRIDGGKDNQKNLQWLCKACHDYEHAKRNVQRAIQAELERLEVLETRLALIEKLNTSEQIRIHGYKGYYAQYKLPLPSTEKCGRITKCQPMITT